jgi:hypothetical protein
VKIQNIQGLKFPDEYFIKFFYKFGFHNKTEKLTFLELGSSNGCNLTLPYQYNFSVLGVDFDPILIEYANHNFKLYRKSTGYTFIAQDMRAFCKEQNNIFSDTLILANSLYYIPKNDFIELLEDIKTNHLTQAKCPFFVRFREINDYRNHKGKELSKNCFILENGVTGEDGTLCVFYETDEMVSLLSSKLGISNYQIMKIQYDNIQNNTVVNNSDVVIWGYINI